MIIEEYMVKILESPINAIKISDIETVNNRPDFNNPLNDIFELIDDCSDESYQNDKN